MKEGEKERGKTREITSFLSILSDFQQIQVKFYWWSNEVKPWKFEKKITKIIVRLTRERKKGRKKKKKKKLKKLILGKK